MMRTWIAGFALLPLCVLGAEVCDRQDTLESCNRKVMEHTPGVTDSVKYELRTANTGQNDAVLDVSSVSLTDFLSLITMAADSGSMSGGEESSERVVLQGSTRNSVLGGDVKFGAVFQRPTIFAPLAAAIDDGDVSDALEDELSNTDDVTLDLSYTYGGGFFGRRWGRTDAQYRELLDAMVQSADPKAPAESADLAAVRSGLIIEFGVTDTDFGRTFSEIELILRTRVETQGYEPKPLPPVLAAWITRRDVCLAQGSNTQGIKSGSSDAASAFAACIVTAYLQLQEKVAGGEIGNLVQLSDNLRRTGFYAVGDLVNNQPQLIVNVRQRVRDERTGQNETSITAKIESGVGRNINTLDSYLKKRTCFPKTPADDAADARATIYAACAEDIATYLTVADPLTGPSERWRFSGSLEYKRFDDYDFSLTEPSVDLHIDSSESFVFSMVAGRSFDLAPASGLPKSRLDLSASYEDVSDDPERNNRSLITGTFSQQIATGATLSVAAVWTNKPELVVEGQDKDLSIQVSINYKVSGKDRPPSGGT